MNIGVIFNPNAGGSDRYNSIGKQLRTRLSVHRLFTGAAAYGSHYVSSAETVGTCREDDFQMSMKSILGSFIEEDVDMMIGVGGDGFLSHIAGFLIQNNVLMPLMGIAGGTTNIGPLLKFNQNSIQHFSTANMIIENQGCIEVSTHGTVLGYAFCDLILGDTFLGTKENRKCHFSAKSFLQTGDKVEAQPGDSVAGKAFEIRKNSRGQNIKIHKVAQVLAAPLNNREFYRGKAITGALCLSSYSDYRASIGICDSIIVTNNPDAVEESIVIEHILLGAEDLVQINGIQKDVSAIIDGNVFGIEMDSIELRYLENIIRSVSMKNHNCFTIYDQTSIA